LGIIAVQSAGMILFPGACWLHDRAGFQILQKRQKQ